MQDHLFFIMTAYIVTALVLTGLIAWVIIEGQGLKKRLKRAESMQRTDEDDNGHGQ